MAKLCMIAREVKRQHLARRYSAKRKALRDVLKDPAASYADKMLASKRLSENPRDASRIRQRTRCQVCGRPRAVYRHFGLCRMHLREAMMRGDVPGLAKASW